MLTPTRGPAPPNSGFAGPRGDAPSLETRRGEGNARPTAPRARPRSKPQASEGGLPQSKAPQAPRSEPQASEGGLPQSNAPPLRLVVAGWMEEDSPGPFFSPRGVVRNAG
jgi:hypothetical protein